MKSQSAPEAKAETNARYLKKQEEGQSWWVTTQVAVTVMKLALSIHTNLEHSRFKDTPYQTWYHALDLIA